MTSSQHRPEVRDRLLPSTSENRNPDGNSRNSFIPTIQAAVLAAVVFAAFVVLQLSAGPDNPVAKATDTYVFPALGFLYVPLAARAAIKATGRLRSAWTVMTIGLACWALGEILTVYYELAGEAPFPSWADVAYLSYIPCVSAALVLFPGARGRRERGRLVLDGVIVTGSVFLTSWLAVMRTVWFSEASSRLEFMISLAYPAGDVLILTLGIMVMVRSTPGLRPMMTLLVAGLACAAVADSMWVYLVNAPDASLGALPDILYLANALLVIVALVAAQGARPGPSVVGAPPGRLSLWLPLLPVAVAAVFVSTAPVVAVTEAPVLTTGAILIAATLLRQFLESSDLVQRQYEVRDLTDRLQAELDSASRYVASVLPGDLAGPVSVCSRYRPSSAVGGDSFGYTWVDDDHLAVYLIDVSGHGVRPALLSMSVHNLLRSRSLSTAMMLEPDELLAQLNSRFGMDRQDDHYFTMWYGVYQLSTGLLRYANAGHPPALLFTEDDGAARCIRLGGPSLPVGMFADTEFIVESHSVPAGSQLLLYSDGVLGEPPQLERLVEQCIELRVGGSCWLDALNTRLPETDDDRSLVLLTFGR